MKKRIAIYLLALAVVFQARMALANDKLVPITDNIYAYVDADEEPENRSFGANAGIIIGETGIVVIDTLTTAKEARQFIADIRSLTDKPIKYVVNTHYHLDHAFGNSEFAKTGAVIIAHVNCRKNLINKGSYALEHISDYGLNPEDMEGTSIFAPQLVFDRNLQIFLDDIQIDIIYPGPGHSTGNVFVAVPSQKIVFAGDILFTDYHPFMGEADIPGWLNALDVLAGMNADKIIPGHGPVSSKTDIIDLQLYLQSFDKTAKKLVAAETDLAIITDQLKAALPKRRELEHMIGVNVQMKYLPQTQ